MSEREARPKRTKVNPTKLVAESSQKFDSATRSTIGAETVSGRVSQSLSLVSKVLQDSRNLLKRISRFASETITKAGFAAIFFVILWFPLGIGLNWPEFAFLGATSAIILLIAIPFLIGGNDYEVAFDLPEDHLVAGEQTNSPIQITNTSNHIQLPGVLEVKIGNGIEEFAIPILRAGETKIIDYVIPEQNRGILPIGPITTVRTDPVSTLRRENRLVDQRDVFVYPKFRQLPRTREGILRDLEGDPTTSIVDSDMSFHSVREYVVGDNPKHIHWKLTAKLSTPGKFMLRQYEESRRSKMLVIFGANSIEFAKNSNEYEVAVSAAASLGVSAIRDQRKISVITGDEVSKLARGRLFAIKELRIQSHKQLLEDLCLVAASDLAMEIKDVCRLAAAKHPDVSLAVIVVGSTFSATSMQQVKLYLPSNVGILFVSVDSSAKAQPTFKEISGMKIFTIQEIQDLPGLMGRFIK